MHTPRYIFRLTIAFLSRFKIIIFFAILIGVLFFFVVNKIFSNESSKVIYGTTGKYNVENIPSFLSKKITKGLTQVDLQGNVIPDLAKSWETPDKGKTWIFKIDNNLFWHDGKRIKSSDLKYNFEEVEVSYPDDSTIVFKLQNNYSAFPYIVTKPVFKKGFVGLGEFSVKKLKLSVNYIERIEIVNDKSGNTEIYRFFPTDERTRLAFKLGQIDVVKDIGDPKDLLTWKKLKINENLNTSEYVGVFFNNQDKLLSEKTFRQALSYAIDKSEYDNNETRAIGPISKNSWAFNSQVKNYNFDLEKAKNIINQYKKDSKSETVEITLSTYPVLLKTAEKVAKDWENIGLKVNIVSITQQPTDYQALIAIFDTPDDPDQYSIWHSTQKNTNITNYQNSRIDKLLEDGRGEIDINTRIKIYLDFQRFLVEDAPVAFLYYPKTYTISR